jgi:uncharacterized protein (TIGR02145 family)
MFAYLKLAFIPILFLIFESCKKEIVTLPIVTTRDISLKTSNSAITGGTVTNDGGSAILSRGVCWSTSTNPTVNDNKTLDSLGTGRYMSYLPDLTQETTYFVKAYAINELGISYGTELQFTTTGDVHDIDGNEYATIGIGTQIWLAENLKTEHYADGSPIQKVSGKYNWEILGVEDKAFCWYNDDSSSYGSIYGALYTWAGAMNGANSSSENPSGIQGVCPSGWHLPSDAEWLIMEDFLISQGFNCSDIPNDIGNHYAKSLAAKTNWNFSYNVGAIGSNDFPLYRNITNFSALPGGQRYSEGSFGSDKSGGYWWTSTENESFSAWNREMNYDYSFVTRLAWEKKRGYSVRCIKDN